MDLDLTRFLIGRTIAEREGVETQRANQLGLIGGLVGSPVVGYLVVRETARREAPPPPVTSDPTGGTAGNPGDPVTSTRIEEVAAMASQANEAAAAATTAANQAREAAAQLATRVEALEKKK